MSEKIIKDEQIFKGRMVDLHLRDVELDNGVKSKREVVLHPQAVCILPIINNEIYFVKQFRSGSFKESLELPAGLIDEGETPTEAAWRELSEEIKYTTDNLEFIGAYYTSPGFTDELIYCFIANNLYQKEKAQDIDEFLTIIKYPISEIPNLLKSGEITDMKTALLLNFFLNSTH